MGFWSTNRILFVQILCKAYCMPFSVSLNIGLLYPPTSRECFSKSEFFPKTNYLCVFCGGNTHQQKWWYIKSAVIYLEKGITLRQTAKDNDSDYPEAAAAVCEKFVMDDDLDSMLNAEQAVNLSRELVEMLNIRWFKLTKFFSNLPEISRKLKLNNKDIENVK